MSNHYKFHAKELLNIALPIIMGNLGFILIGAGDVLVAGRHSTDTLAAISIATAILNTIFTPGIGLLSSVTTILSNTRGQGDCAKKYFYPTIRASLVVSIVTMILIWCCIPVVDLLGFEAHLIYPIKEYMLITSFSCVAIFLHIGLKEFLQAHEIVFFPNLLTLICVVLNVILCFMFVFGAGPIPSMGVVGLAIATFLVRFFMFAVLAIYSFSVIKCENYVSKGYFKNIIKIGLPISLAIMIEFVAFNSIAIIMGRVSGVYAAAQNLVCTMTTISFMVPLAISSAIAVKVGFANGANNTDDLKKYSFVGIAMSVGFMAFSAIIFALFPKFLTGLFTRDANLIAICVPIIYVLAMFQVFDGLQVALSGVFKGIKKTKIVMISNLIAYWFFAIPLGYMLAFKYNLKIMGFWYGLLLSSIILCILMSTVLRRYMAKISLPRF